MHATKKSINIPINQFTFFLFENATNAADAHMYVITNTDAPYRDNGQRPYAAVSGWIARKSK